MTGVVEIQKFLEALKVVATSPMALVGYLVVAAAWVYVTTTSGRLKQITKAIKDLPERDRLVILKKEYNTTPRNGLSAEEWIRARKQLLWFFAFVTTILALVVLVLTAILRPIASTPETIVPLKGPFADRTPDPVFSTNGLTIKQVISGKPPDAASKIFDVTISNSSTNQTIVNKFEITWRYKNGVLSAVDHGAPLVPVAKYVLEIQIDPDTDEIKKASEVMYPSLVLPPGNESGPSLTTFRLQIHYKFTGRINWHPNDDWDIAIEVACLSDANQKIILIPASSWRFGFPVSLK